LEAAVTAATAGHRVKIFERDADSGGQIWLAGAPPHKRELLEFIRYYRAMLKKHDILLCLNTEVDNGMIRQENPDYLVVAEGAEALVPPIKGAANADVLSAWDVLADRVRMERSVAIIGGGAVGLETAMFVAAKGTLDLDTLRFLLAYEAQSVARLKELMFQGNSKVTVFEMLPRAGSDVGRSTRWVLF
ncbi:MAG: FAD-dependent oxidoreductase, partial [Gammaproteobacteria bacterium]|nr:FAD-dependent oxidoreductase [Gammaproteobacteria bacterium]